MGVFRIKGVAIKDSVCIEAGCAELPAAEAIVEVVANRVEDHEFLSSLEFEHKTYQLVEGSTRTLRLFARCPELVNGETPVEVASSDLVSLPVIGRCLLTPIKGTNYALCEVRIRARRLKKSPILLTAHLNGSEASAKVRVTLKEEKGIQIRIALRDEPFGVYRSIWNEREGRPNELLISTHHESIRRYLTYNAETKTYEGDQAAHFRVLLAEIVTEAVCRKSLMLETKSRPWEFQWADMRSPGIIADAVATELQKRIRDFAAEAHRIMLEAPMN